MGDRFENPFQLLRELRGCELYIFWALCMATIYDPGPKPNSWIETAAHFGDKPIARALAILEEDGLAIHNRYGWILGARGLAFLKDFGLAILEMFNRNGWTIGPGAKQLPLMATEESSDIGGPKGPDGNNQPPSYNLDPDANAPVADGLVSRQDPGARRQPEHSGRKGGKESETYSESETFRLSSSSSSLKLDSTRKTLLPLDSRPAESESFRLSLEECDRQGIREPKRSWLAKMPHVSPALIRAHCAEAPNLSMAMHRIAANWIPKRTVSMETVAPEDGSSFSMETPSEEDPIDNQAEGWWAAILIGLKEQVPRGILANFLSVRAVRRIGDELQALVPNVEATKELARYIRSPSLDELASLASGGTIKRFRFVTVWEDA